MTIRVGRICWVSGTAGSETPARCPNSVISCKQLTPDQKPLGQTTHTIPFPGLLKEAQVQVFLESKVCHTQRSMTRDK